jgi:hypothetical protein
VTVPQLCATATVVGTSAVGLSFGRETDEGARDAASNIKRKATATATATATTATPARELAHRPMSAAAVLGPATSTAAHALYQPLPRSSSTRVPITTRYRQDGRPERRIVRRMTSDDAPLRPSSAVTNTSLVPPTRQEVENRERPSYSTARRSSWIKRLSNVSNSQSSSRNSSPAPLTPSVSCSNRSTAFSHNGSTTPIIGDRPPPPLPPNKLVKRSSSIRTARETAVQGSGPRRLPSLRRPATSHQRSATLLHHSALMDTAEDPSDEQVQPSPSTNSDMQYTQFFTVKTSKEKSLRRGSATLDRSMKRIIPDDKHTPTLVIAKAVTAAGAYEGDSLSNSEDGDSLYFTSRPSTPIGITAVIASRPDPPNAVDQGQSNVPSVANAPRPRRSFSITELLLSGSNAMKQRTARLPSARLARRPSQRASSTPLSNMAARQSSTAHGDHPAAAAAISGRQDFHNPASVRREISTSAGPTLSGNPRNGFHTNSSFSLLPALPLQRAAALPEHGSALMHQREIKPASASTNQITPPLILAQPGRPSRHSVAPSEQASTLVGSDNEARYVGSGDEDDADLQSETCFDSLHTGATRSTSGARGPRIETIFDESPPAKVRVTALRDLLPKGTFRDQGPDGAPGHHSIAEEEESISTPVRTIVPERSISDSPSLARRISAPLFPALIPSSPPDMPKPLSLGTLEWDSRAEDDSSSRWSLGGEDEDDPWADLPAHPPATHVATPVSLGRHNPRLIANGSSPKPPSTPQNLVTEHHDRDARSSIFDWSEQQPADKISGNGSPPRPRTVHGKKDADRRGSRAVGRRVPSGLHARSQSVPVVPDAAGKRSTVVTNKFGTWGVGSKGVTEDWNDDFDFSELPEDSATEGALKSHRVDSGTATMVVPRTIQEQQTNVLANIGLLREWGLLIEELKEQKVRAVTLGLLEGSDAGMWEEVDAMIDLADQEAEHDGVPRLSPPSSPGFDEDAFDDVSHTTPNHGRGRQESGESATNELGKKQAYPGSQQPGRSKRRSILPSNQLIFTPHSSPIPSKSRYEPPMAGEQPSIVTRPRKDSEAKARSVIEALQKRKGVHEPVADLPLASSTKKVPFDTATLRRIVPYVNTLTHKVKSTLREAEGLYSSPNTTPNDPPLTRVFHSDNVLAAQLKLMTIT